MRDECTIYAEYAGNTLTNSAIPTPAQKARTVTPIRSVAVYNPRSVAFHSAISKSQFNQPLESARPPSRRAIPAADDLRISFGILLALVKRNGYYSRQRESGFCIVARL